MDKRRTIRRFHCRLGQGITEYFIIMLVVLIAILSTGFIGRMHNSLKIYFDNAAARISNP